MINTDLLTNYSSEKYILFPNDYYPINNKLIKLLLDMNNAFHSDIIINEGNPIKLSILKKIFIDFNKRFIAKKSKLMDDVNKMQFHISFIIVINDNEITVNILCDKCNINIIAVILHAINTFCNLFNDHDYDGLTINIVLDNNNRIIDIPETLDSYSEKINYLKKNSLAFNVSGVTVRNKKIITLTRSEEIIKLLFHELIHYIELDDSLLNTTFNKNWSIESDLNISETYTEFLAVILNSMYQSIHLNKLLNVSLKDIFSHIIQKEINYSIYLTSNILKFYGYNKYNYKSFFTNDKINKTPLPLWEYIFLRTMLMINLNNVIDDVPSDYKIINTNVLVNLLNNDNDLINGLAKLMLQQFDRNVSYNAVDLNWSKF